MKLLVALERDETGMLVAECPSIPGCISQGRTEAARVVTRSLSDLKTIERLRNW